ncbi:hypothetical protein BCR42DRAFT_426976 [Absidia repens]|uniref:Uncharacterized protein n=1 Tax=Absidia repens TaxID=90262 RepID=A0A1X2I1X5_9FUNG|nr:hypothetical protein BCR42DRAFT_426976 [Absidia repens]
MLPQEVDASSGVWSNNSSNASLHEYTLPTTANTTSTTKRPQHQNHQNRSSSLGLSDISVGDILEIYKHDTDLLRHILMAKAEEDKRRAAEEVRRTEEARLQCKYLELGWEHQKQMSDPSTFTNEFLSGSLGSLAVSSTDIPDWLSIPPNNTMTTTLSPSPMAASLSHFDQTPPSPTTSYYRPRSPFTTTSFDVPFADLAISTSASPEPRDSCCKVTMPNSINVIASTAIAPPSSSSSSSTAIPGTVEVNASQQNSISTSPQNRHNFLAYPPPPLPPHSDEMPNEIDAEDPTKQTSSCKRTLSRTRSQRRPHVVPGKKKNRSAATIPPQQQQSVPMPSSSVKDEAQLDHVTVMEALRAKLRRSSNPPVLSNGDTATLSTSSCANSNNHLIWPKTLEQIDHVPQSMSPQGMLLLDLKNPRKVFNSNRNNNNNSSSSNNNSSNNSSNKRTTMNQRVAVLRRPKPFASAHNHCDKTKDTK